MNERLIVGFSNPALRDHHLHGQHLLPGLAYIDLLYQVFRKKGHDYRELELRNLAIYQPLVAQPGGAVVLDIQITEAAPGQWRITCAGRPQSEPGRNGASRRYITAEMHRAPPARFEETIDRASLQGAASHVMDLQEFYAECRQRGLVHEQFMKADGKLLLTDSDVYVDCFVSDGIAAGTDAVMFHPALIDASATCGGGGLWLLGDRREQRLILPLFYESFRAAELLGKHCITRLQLALQRHKNELNYFTLEFFNTAGRKIAQLSNFAGKIVRDSGFLDKKAETPARGETSHTIYASHETNDVAPLAARAPAGATPAEVESFLRQLVAARLQHPVGRVDPRAGYYELGVDSAGMLELVREVESKVGVPLPPTLLFEYTTIAELAEYLAANHAWPSDTAAPSAEMPSPRLSMPPDTAARVHDAVSSGANLAPVDRGTTEDIAVIGMAGRFPAASDIREFWTNLMAGKDCITEVPAARWDWHMHEGVRSVSGKNLSRWGGFVADADCFDAAFFRISPREAEAMDPQERLFLEVCWEALEDAGYTPKSVVAPKGADRRRAVGVFAGLMHKDYALLANEALAAGKAVPFSPSNASIANRVSFFCNFHGPSMVLDTVCSSSLVAVHLAVQSLRSGECEAALAGGVNLSLHPSKYFTYGVMDMHASDGRCHTFGKGGDGYVSADGIGAVLLKPLSQAVADGDHIYALIKGCATNHGGSVGGFTVPSPVGQADVITRCLDASGVDPRTISYVEAHGTGTSLGDPIEIEGLTRAYRGYTKETQFCAIGSVKSNIGHAESAAGVSGLIKVALQLEHRTLVPSLHAAQPNPLIQWPQTPFFVQRELQPWPQPPTFDDGVGRLRRAGLSSFGATGSNAHVILEEYRAPEPQHVAAPNSSARFVVPLSARNSERLQCYAQKLSIFIADTQIDLASLAYTLQVGREAFESRVVFVVPTLAALVEQLNAYVESKDHTGFVGEIKRGGPGQASPDATRLDAWLQANDLEQLAQAWAEGYPLDWHRLYGENKPRRASLPTYPFAKERFWIEQPARLTSRSNAKMEEQATGATAQTFLFERRWEQRPLAETTSAAEAKPARERSFEQRVLLDPAYAPCLPQLEVHGAALQVEALTHVEGTIAPRVAAYGVQVLQRVQSILQGRCANPVLLQIVLPLDSGEGQLLSALSGLLKSAARENPKFLFQIIETDTRQSAQSLLAKLQANANAPRDQEIRYLHGQRHVVELTRYVAAEKESVLPWRDAGVYLITGGAGGLGLVFAREIATRTKGARIVLAGRSAPREELQSRLRACEANGAQVEYQMLDVADRTAVRACIYDLIECHGALHGVIHGAGVIRDSFLIKKTAEEVREVLTPKVHGLVNLDHATAELALDCFILFSSVSGAIGNVGQADYAMANAFMDRYAEYRNALVQSGQRRGRTLSINWPLWAQGGMQIDAANVEQMRRAGIHPLSTAAGISALYAAYTTDRSQMMVLAAEQAALDRLLAAASVNTLPANVDEKCAALDVTGIDAESLKEKTLQKVKQVFSSVTKLAAPKLDEHEPLESYGIDSIMIMQLNQRLAEVFGELSKTLFYEYPTLAQLRDYLVTAHALECAKWCGLQALKNQPASPAADQRPVNADVTPPTSRSAQWRPRANALEQEPIAVIGLSGRYPQSRDMQAYWEHLRSGKDCIVEIPPERWSVEGFYEADLEAAVSRGKSYSKWGGFLEGFAEFDPLFFNISPREAQNMDPQERLFLQASWSVLEDAGYTRELIAQRHQGRVGVFAGITKTGFDLYGPALWAQGQDVFPHTSFSSVANRVSYLLDLHGPSMPIDTMCSASLTAIHEACEHLLRDECEMALAGGVNLYLHPSSYVALCGQRMLSVDGRCRSFGAGGTGFVPGEGVGVVLLKRLSRAQADGDPIRAVIRASGVNHGGKTHGYTVPNPKAQGDLIRRTLQKAGIHPRAISYIEAHGTGTQLGDPIELSGLTQAFGEQTQDRQYCALGSVKSNIGHLEAAAGIAGVTKIVLQMEHQALAPSLHAQELNPNIDFERTPFVMQRTATPWQRPKITLDGEEREYPRIAGISSFGAGGSNAHVILEEYVEPSPVRVAMPPGGEVIIVLSAKSELQLQQQVQNLLEALQRGGYSDADLPNIAYTLQVGREAMEQRLAFTASSLQMLKEKLTAFLRGPHESHANGSDDFYRGEANNSEPLALFAADEELQRAVAAWMARGKYSKLLSLWSQGLNCDWSKLYPADQTPRRIPLPTYPFATQLYWIAQQANADEAPHARPEKVERIRTDETIQNEAQAPDLLTFEQVWQAQPGGDEEQPIERLVCFVSSDRWQAVLSASFQKRSPDLRVTFIAAATGDVPGRERFQVDPSREHEFEAALRDAARQMGGIDGVLYLWGLEDARYRCDSLPIVYMLRGLGRAQLQCKRVLLGVEFDESAESCIAQSWIGFESSLKMVLPETTVAVVGERRTEQAASTDDVPRMLRWARHLWSELTFALSESALYQEEQRLVLRMQPRALQPGAAVIRHGGTYLITGGMGGLGKLIARHLARVYAARLILVGRSALDEARQQEIAHLQRLGGTVVHVKADVCNVEEMRAGLRPARDRFGSIHGVIHAAGIESRGSVLDKKISDYRRVLAPKIDGTLALDEILQDEALDFICYFSSAAAILGDFGACDYALGNRFQMHYAQYRNRQQASGRKRGKAIAIHWPLWAEGGMGLKSDEATHLYIKSSGQRTLQAEEGVAMFERLLSQECSHCLVLAGQPSRLQRFLGLAAPRQPQRAKTNTQARSARRAELRGLSVAQCVEWELKQLAGELLRLPRDQLKVDANLADFGFDSISLAQFARRLAQQFGVEFTPSLFFSHTTVQKLVRYFCNEHAALVQQLYGTEQSADVLEADDERSHEVAAVTAGTVAGYAARPAAGTIIGQEAHEMARNATADLAGVPEPIAIIGMSGRFPGARSVDELWTLLEQGKEAIVEIPPERFDWRDYYSDSTDDADKITSKWLGALPGVAEFDAPFFEISPREAQLMDPRQRLLLQESWRALEDAGYGLKQLDGQKIGMYVGVEQGDYQLMTGARGGVTANHDGVLAARLAYFLNLRGPAMAINTACSSGVVAVHQACMSLRAGECDTAIAAGVNLLLTPQMYIGMSQAGMLSADGKCYAFDKRANGLVPAEAVVAVVLKRLSQAQAQGDAIYAVIRGSGINYDGRTNGITAPSGASQTQLIKEVHQQAQVPADDVEFIVTHGTGTRLGDPVEINALKDAFGPTQRTGYCALTSPKSNVGHTFAASGLLNLVALVQALRHEVIPASLHSEQLSDYIDWTTSPFYVNQAKRSWPQRPGRARLGAVSAFGMSGTNAHLVVESHDEPQRDVTSSAAPYYLLALSAKTPEALQRKAHDLLCFLQEEPWNAASLGAMSFTLLRGRVHFNHRCAIVVEDRDSAVHLLGQCTGPERLPNVFRGKVDRESNVQQALQLYAEDLLRQLPELHGDRTRYQQSICALAELFCQGYDLPWPRMFGARPPRTLHLPAYPFSTTQHWVPGEKISIPAQASVAIERQDKLPERTEAPAAVQPDAAAKPQRLVLRSLNTTSAAAQERAASGRNISKQETNDEQRERQALAEPPSAGVPPMPEREQRTAAPAAVEIVADAAPSPDFADLLRELSMSLGKALYLDGEDLDVHKPFTELGLDSIIGVEWVRELNRRYGCDLNATQLYDYSNLHALAGWLSQALKGRAAGQTKAPALQPVEQAEHPPEPRQKVVGERVPIAEPARMPDPAPRRKEAPAPAAAQQRDAIAIVGMSGRYPGARNLQEYWENLAAGRNTVEEIPASRWDVNEYYAPEFHRPGKIYCKWLGRLDDVECFDPLFFNIAPAEAELMDPQQRLFLEESYRAFEVAGYGPQQLSNSKCGVYLGIVSSEYGLLLHKSGAGFADTTGNSPAIAAARIAYFLNLKGPALPIDTACSSSLVAAHLACQALRQGEIDMALVGGVSLYLAPESYLGMCSAGMLSPQGQCKAFDNTADGFVPGEGVGALVLKRLKDAENAGDRIYGLIIGSGINQDGKTNGITAPSASSQIELERDVYQRYRIHPQSISYVEMHGTGTKLGDPIELAALATVFKEQTGSRQYCALGSVKSNIGHTSAAAGVASVHKVLLAMAHQELVPTLNFNTPNEHFDFARSPFYVNTERRPWESSFGEPRRAAVSSFGYSGTNAHLVIEEYRPSQSSQIATIVNTANPVLVVLSAKSQEQMRACAGELLAHVEAHPGIDLPSLAYTLQVGRAALEHRLAFTAESREKLLDTLREFKERGAAREAFSAHVKKNKEGMSLFDGDEEFAALLQSWIDKKKLKKLAEVWSRGLSIDWLRLYGDYRPQRIPLPTYPFARERHWVKQPRAQQRRESAAAAAPILPVRASRPAAADAERAPNTAFEGNSEVTLTAVWEAQKPDRIEAWPTQGQSVALIGGTGQQQQAVQKLYPQLTAVAIGLEMTSASLATQLNSLGSIDHVFWIAPAHPARSVADETVIADQRHGVLSLFNVIKALLHAGFGARALGLTIITVNTQGVHPAEDIDPTHASVHGLIGSLAKEYSHWQVRLVDLEDAEHWPMEPLLRLPADPYGNAWAVRHGEWYRERLLPCVSARVPDQAQSLQLRRGGVYVVIGGAGGIGEVFTEYLLRRYQAHVIWLGRREQDAAIEAKLRRLADIGPAPQYLRADATDRAALQHACNAIKSRHRVIHGVIHAAIVLSDQSLGNMDAVRFSAGLAAKLAVSVRIAQVFAQERPELVLFFSSLQTYFKAPGQSNYAAGCTASDALARQLAREWPGAVKVMNWGYWGNVGIVAADVYRERTAQQGFGSIEPAEGMAALERLLAAPLRQLAFLKITQPQVLAAICDLRQEVRIAEQRLLTCSPLSAVATREAAPMPAEQFSSETVQSLADMQTMLVQLLFSQLQALGLFTQGRQSWAKWQQEMALPPFYRRWLAESLRTLVAHGYISVAGEWCGVADVTTLDRTELWSRWDERRTQWLTDPDLRAHVRLVDATVRALPDILTGKVAATSVLFPNSSLELLEGIYKHNRIADYFNAVLTHTLVDFVQRCSGQDAEARLRILEIGAGTGGTSERVLRQLRPYRDLITEYCYTDVSKAFLLHAQSHYAPEHPYVTTALFDVERPLAEQSVAVGAYDVVIASNVLHATSDMRQTLRNAKAALKADGLLLLNEIAAESLVAHLTFGLLEGWWKYEDDALRIPGSPGMYPAVWQRVLAAEGFHSVRFPAAEAHAAGQQVIAAHSNGVIRQRHDAVISASISSQAATVPGVVADEVVPNARPAASIATASEAPKATTQFDVLRERGAHHIRKVMSEVLKIPLERIDPAESLAQYGIDSILVVRLTNALREMFAQISSNVFFEHPTIDAVVEHLLHADMDSWPKLAAEGAAVVSQVSSAERAPMSSARAVPRQNCACAALAECTEIEVLQPEGHLTPAIWFHGLLGTVQNYAALARTIGSSLPFYGVQSRGIKSAQPPIEDMTEMAAHYTSILATHLDKNMPFQLGGYSGGGIIAYEVARQLQERGRHVRNIVMLDVPYAYGAVPLHKNAEYAKLLYGMLYSSILGMNNLGVLSGIGDAQLRNLSLDEVLSYLVEDGMRKGLPYSRDELQELMQRHYQVAEANGRAAASYTVRDLPRPGEIECHYFQRKQPQVFFEVGQVRGPVKEQMNAYYQDKPCAMHWRRQLPNFTCHPTGATDHFSLLTEEAPFESILNVCLRLYKASE